MQPPAGAGPHGRKNGGIKSDSQLPVDCHFRILYSFSFKAAFKLSNAVTGVGSTPYDIAR